MPETYAYNEDAMMKSIGRFRASGKLAAAPPPSPVPAGMPISRIVIERAAVLFGFDAAYLMGPSKEYRLRPARQAIGLVLRRRYRYSLPQIGRAMKRHHTSIMNMLQNAELCFATDPAFREKVELMLNEAVVPISPDDSLALAVLDLDRMRDEIECGLPQALHKLADSIESGEIEAKASVVPAAGPSHDPRAHCLVKIHLAAQIRQRLNAEGLEAVNGAV